MIYQTCLRKIPVTIMLLASLFCTTSVQAFSEIDIQFTLNINWEESIPLQNTIDLGMDSTTDTWVVRYSIVGSGLSVDSTCNGNQCEYSVFAEEIQDANIQASIQSTTEADLSLTPFNYDAFRSLDEFEYYSDGNGGGPDYAVVTDVLNGLYVKPGGNQLESWTLERNILGSSLGSEIQANSQALVQFFNSGGASFEIEEHFLNHLQQISYSKFGSATVTDVLVIDAQNNPYPLECQYKIVSDRGEGFQSAISITNVSDEAIDGWMLMLEFADAVYIDDYWGASISGYIPWFVTTSLEWNDIIYPDQEVNIGILGSKSASQTADATLRGKLCR